MVKTSANSFVCRNRKATHDYELLEKLECGIVLTGTEVKSLREKNASLSESYARIENNELWLIGFHIASYKHGVIAVHDPTRRRKLLAHTRQIRKLEYAVAQKGFTLVPLSVFFNKDGFAKVEIALARGKARADKRESLKTRAARRDIQQEMRRR